MSATEATAPTALTTEILDLWIANRREMIVRDGSVVRAGDDLTIEVQLMHRVGHVFQRINSPDGTQSFGSVEARDAIVRRLQGETP